MKKSLKTLIITGIILLVISGAASLFTINYFQSATSQFPSNSILVIEPYRYAGFWVFDDSRTGLVREPFVSGVPEMIDKLVENIPDANDGFRLIFSLIPFPGCQEKLIWLRAEGPGNWYYSETHNLEGWLCPGLFKYFKKTPKEIYVKAEAKK